MQNIKIEGLDQLNELLALLVSVLATDKGMVNTAKAAKEMQFKEEENESIEVETSITREQIRSAFVKVNNPTNRSALKDLLAKYGAKSVSDLDNKYYVNIMKDLEELK